jgi:mono/diheme cytochrome c family protein
MKLKVRFTGILLSAGLALVSQANADDTQNAAPHVSYVDGSHSTLLLDVAGKQYVVDVAAGSIRAAGTIASQTGASQTGASQTGASQAPSPAAGLFQQNCAGCHGTDGKGTRGLGTPDFTSHSIQSGLSDQQVLDTIRNGKAGRMPAWAGKLSDAQITALAAYIRSFATAAPGSTSTAPQEAAAPGVYQPGDDVLVSLPTGKTVDRHGLYVNFAHRFMDTAFTGPGKGGELLGLDSVSISSFGLRYGVTDKFSVSVWRSPSFIERPIQLMAAYKFLDENHGAPLNLSVRVSVEGQNNFQKSFTENIETIFSRSITSHAQFYAVPTFSFNARRLEPGGLVSSQIPDFPGVDTFSIGFGAAVDIRPTVALVAEIIPTLLNAVELGIHRPAYSFGIQKKIWRHAFTLALTNSPGTTVSQRAGTRATYTGMPNSDTPAGLSLGFDVMRQIY